MALQSTSGGYESYHGFYATSDDTLWFSNPWNYSSSTTSGANGISSDGSVVVGWISQDAPFGGVTPIEAFKWTASEGTIGLGFLDPAHPASNALAISFDGNVVVGNSNVGSAFNSHPEAFCWTQQEGMVGLGTLNPALNSSTTAWAVSGDGSIIVGEDNSPWPRISKSEAFIWDDFHGMRNLQEVLENDYGLDLSSWTLQAARGISFDGTKIIGYGINPSGHTEAWLVNIPEPSTVSLLSLGLVLFGRKKYHRSL